jgi:hypothetical protein
MKRNILLFIFFLGTLLSCSTSNREDLMKDYCSDIKNDHSRWAEVLESYVTDGVTSTEELNRHFFYYNQKTTFERRDVRLVLKFFDINSSDSLFLEYTKLIDKKNSLVVNFYLNKEVMEDDLKSLVAVENDIITVLAKIEKRILNK